MVVLKRGKRNKDFDDVSRFFFWRWKESAISRLRNGKKDFTKLSLEFVMRVQAWIDKNEK